MPIRAPAPAPTMETTGYYYLDFDAYGHGSTSAQVTDTALWSSAPSLPMSSYFVAPLSPSSEPLGPTAHTSMPIRAPAPAPIWKTMDTTGYYLDFDAPWSLSSEPLGSAASTSMPIRAPAPAPIRTRMETTGYSDLYAAPIRTRMDTAGYSDLYAVPFRTRMETTGYSDLYAAPIRTWMETTNNYFDFNAPPMPTSAKLMDTALWSSAPSSPVGSYLLAPLSSSSSLSSDDEDALLPHERHELRRSASYSAFLTSPQPEPYARTIAEPSRCRVEVRQVWSGNFKAEVERIESLLPLYRYVAVDTEFPGTMHRTPEPTYLLTADKRYELLKANVDELDIIQLGLTLFNHGGGDDRTNMVWEFNFREFDVVNHRHAEESIKMLRGKGVDFARTKEEGVEALAFGARLRKWLRSTRRGGLGLDGVVTFSGGYDMAYLVKVMFGSGYKLPATAEEFEAVLKILFRQRNLYDVKEMARHYPGDLRGGLDSVAVKLGVPRSVGEAHQAGSDSLLTCHTFMKMRELYFDDDIKLTRVAGKITEITAFS